MMSFVSTFLMKATRGFWWNGLTLFLRMNSRMLTAKNSAELIDVRDPRNGKIIHHELVYTINGLRYIQQIPHLRGPSIVSCITDEHFNDITDRVIPYLGPNLNWHGVDYKMSFFGVEEMVFHLEDGNVLYFKQDYVPQDLKEYIPVHTK